MSTPDEYSEMGCNYMDVTSIVGHIVAEWNLNIFYIRIVIPLNYILECYFTVIYSYFGLFFKVMTESQKQSDLPINLILIFIESQKQSDLPIDLILIFTSSRILQDSDETFV